VSNTKTAPVPALVIRRTFNAPRTKVFDAFTDAASLRTWLCPPEAKITDLTADVREGGKYRIAFLAPDGEAMTVTGIYSEVKRPERIAYTWRWQEDNAADERDTFIKVEFAERAGATEMTFTHEGFVSEESRGRHEQGWNGSFMGLEALFKG
jgi:uncharacterized protein YndB with AHSA1/START domain